MYKVFDICTLGKDKPKCKEGHQMNVSSYAEGIYEKGYRCNSCNEVKQGERWNCESCLDNGGYDYCFDCVPKTGNHPKI